MLIIVMMIHAVGISQISHICKMAVSCQVENGCCTDSESESREQSKDLDCCEDVFKYFHQEADVTIQQGYKLQLQHLFISLLIVPVPIPEYREMISFFGEGNFKNAKKSWSTIFIDLQTFLI